MLQVTKSYLPDLEEYVALLKGVWERGHLTNDGPLLKQLEQELALHLNVKEVLYTSNGTIALQLAIKALDLKGKIITTPFSYCATVNSILWEQCEPVFADIDSETLTVNSQQLKAVYQPEVLGIMTTHVYGNAGDLEEQEGLAKEWGIPLIYDGAHAFGVKNKEGESIFDFGDISTCSFHATKLFHTVEGGAVFAKDQDLLQKVRGLRSFGHKNDDYFAAGINGKNSEFHAAMGLVNLKHFQAIKSHRKWASEFYDAHLPKDLQKFQWNPNWEKNYGYYPVIFDDEAQLLRCLNALNQVEIFPRRYFYPALNTLRFVPSMACPVAEDVAKRIACLPLSASIAENDLAQICQIIQENLA